MSVTVVAESAAVILRRAEALSRERVAAASPGPWREMCLGSEGCQVLNDGHLRDRKHVSFSGRKEWKADHADAQYVALMDPLVGAAMADLFSKTAWMVGLAEEFAARVPVDQVLALAAAVLGEKVPGHA